MADIVGIMGGTFNPVHKGHIAIAKAARTIQYITDSCYAFIFTSIQRQQQDSFCSSPL